jgi:hypothetical protein
MIIRGARQPMAMDRSIRESEPLALDRASVRSVDQDGHMHVEVSNITKANICEYMGREIPDWQRLGLDQHRTYRLLRDADELEKATPTLNGKPLMQIHQPVHARAHPRREVVGSIGTNASWQPPYLTNALTVWAQDAIDGINSKRKCQLSAGYRFAADMTPGSHEGLPYDGKMRDIQFNHVTLVVQGRAGPDVIVGDSGMKLKSRTALMVSGALQGLVAPSLAQDAKVDITDALKDVTGATFAMDGAPAALAKKVVELVTPHLAQDAELSEDDVTTFLQSITPIAQDDAIADPKPVAKPVAKPVDPANPVDPIALDEATVSTMIADAVGKATKATEARMIAIDTARRAVQPFVGDVAMDSADEIYKFALDHLKVDLTDVPSVAYAAVLKMQPKPGTKPTVIAQDRAPSKLKGILGDTYRPMGII